MVTVEQVIAAANNPAALVPLLFLALRMDDGTDVVQLILTAVNSLALKSQADRSFLGEMEACLACSLAMARFQDHEKVLELACAAVAGLAMDNEANQSRFGEENQQVSYNCRLPLGRSSAL